MNKFRFCVFLFLSVFIVYSNGWCQGKGDDASINATLRELYRCMETGEIEKWDDLLTKELTAKVRTEIADIRQRKEGKYSDASILACIGLGVKQKFFEFEVLEFTVTDIEKKGQTATATADVRFSIVFKSRGDEKTITMLRAKHVLKQQDDHWLVDSIVTEKITNNELAQEAGRECLKNIK